MFSMTTTKTCAAEAGATAAVARDSVRDGSWPVTVGVGSWRGVWLAADAAVTFGAAVPTVTVAVAPLVVEAVGANVEDATGGGSDIPVLPTQPRISIAALPTAQIRTFTLRHTRADPGLTTRQGLRETKYPRHAGGPVAVASRLDTFLSGRWLAAGPSIYL
jgi:hypothetical protein